MTGRPLRYTGKASGEKKTALPDGSVVKVGDVAFFDPAQASRELLGQRPRDWEPVTSEEAKGEAKP